MTIASSGKPGYIYNGSEWVPIGTEINIHGASVQSTAPTSPATGDLWVDTSASVSALDPSTLATQANVTSGLATKLDIPGAWTAYSPTIGAETGTPTTTGVNVARYCKVGRVVFVHLDVYIASKGTASNRMTATLPFAAAYQGFGSGRENSVTGGALFVQCAGSTAWIGFSGTGTTWVTGYTHSVIFFYESTS